MKATKNINANYRVDTGRWTIRDNGELLREGQGLPDYIEAVKEIRQTATKPIKETMRW
jgi:hypothetical protein